MSARRLSPEGRWTRGGVPAWTLGPEGGGLEGHILIGERERVLARTLGLEGGWIVRSHIGWTGERIILYKGVETFP